MIMSLRYLAGLEEYDRVWVHEDRAYEERLPEEPGTVHAVPVTSIDPQPRPGLPAYLDGWQTRVALCGAPVRVLLPTGFPPQDPDACPTCADLHAQGADAPFRHPADRYHERDRQREEADVRRALLDRQEYLARESHDPDDEDDPA